jgi:hypothetical protein
MFDIHRGPQDEYGEFDHDRVGEYVDGLMQEFAASPEGKALYDAGEDLHGVAFMLEYSLGYLGLTPPKMTLRDFNEVVFQLIPKKVSTPAESGPGFIREIKGFWEFAQRQYGLRNAAPILATLGEKAMERLRQALADPANFGMAKSFIMAGQEAGYDMTTQKGMEEFTAIYNASLLSRSLPSPLQPRLSMRPSFDRALLDLPPDSPPSNYKQEKRKERKRQRQARKRNRR